jgi:hypothetical protein
MAKKPISTFSVGMAGLLFITTQPAMPGSMAVNDCLIVAAKAQYELSAAIWSRLLVVRYDASRLQHVYLVYATATDEIASFDSVHGTRRFHTEARSASELARIIDPHAIWGWYVEENANNRNLFAQQH